MNRYIVTAIALLNIGASWASQQWQPLNPGAGGQVQDIVTDPNQANVVYLASDMEGVYKSSDNGEHWHITGQLVNNRVYAISVAPGDSNKVLVGTLYGLHVSTDGGATYELAPETENVSIASVAYRPDNTNQIIAAPGWRDDNDFIGKFGETANGLGQVFVSQNGGDTWQTVTFDSDTSTDRNVYSVVFNPQNGNEAYLSSNKGVFKSMDAGLSWTKLANPTADRPKSKGLTISPDGKVLYAVFAKEPNNNQDWALFTTKSSSIVWQVAYEGLEGWVNYWYPEVDPRSTSTQHQVILPMHKKRAGLLEGTFNWSTEGQLENYSWTQIWGDADGRYDGSYDMGWDFANPPNARVAHYSPDVVNGERGIWSTTNQTIYYASFDSATNQYTWHNKYSTPNHDIVVNWWGTDWPTYSAKGTESTYTYDVAVHENYVIQGQADNGLVESWDGGISWSNMQHRRAGGNNLSDVQAVDIADAWGTPVVVAQATSGYGGAAHNGRLWVKELITHSPTDQWVELAGGPKELNGLPKGVLRDVAVSPVNPAKVFIFSSNYGMYMIEDIGRMLDYHKQGKDLPVTQIYQSENNSTDAFSARTISPHPTNEDIVFFTSTGGVQGVWRGERAASGEWSFQQVISTSGWDAEVHAWEHNGEVYLMNFAKGGGPDYNDGNNWHILLSKDDGNTWTKVLSPAIAKQVKPTSSVIWWDAIGEEFEFKGKGGATGYADKIVMSYYDHDYQKSYGVFLGTIGENDSVSWQDITGDLHFAGMTNSKFIESQGQMHLYSATPGAGLWRTTLPNLPVPSKPVTGPANTTGLNGALIAQNNTIVLNWVDGANNESGYRIERKTAASGFKLVGQVGKNATRFIDFDLANYTDYTYRVYAINDVSAGGYSNTVTVTSGETYVEPEQCEPVELLADGNFESGKGAWNLYVNGNNGADASMAVTSQANFGVGQSLFIDINSVNGANDIQLQRFVGQLETDKTYRLSLTAKASLQRTALVKIHQSNAPWQNVKNGDYLELTGEPQTFDIDYTPTFDMGNLTLGVFLGDQLGDVSIDEVSLKWHCDDTSDETGTEPLTAPASVSVTALDASSIQVDWPAVTGATSYDIHIQQDGGSWGALQMGVSGTSYSADALQAGVAYRFKVRALRDQEQTSWTQSNVITLEEQAELTAPASVTASLDGENVQIVWTEVAVATAYDLHVQKDGGNWGPLAMGLTTTNYLATDLSESGSYRFKVRAVKDAEQTSWTQSNSVAFESSTDPSPEPLTMPSYVNATATSNSSVQLEWQNIASATAYDVHYQKAGGYWGALQMDVTTTSYLAQGLEPGATYRFKVRAKNSEGQTSWKQSSDVTLTETAEFGPPSSATATVTSATSVALSWSSVFDAATYDVQSQLSGETTWRKVQYDVTSTSIDVEGLEPNATYTFRVKSRKASGSASGWTNTNAVTLSGNSTPTESTPQEQEQSVPEDNSEQDGGDGQFGAPNDLEVASYTQSSVTLAWRSVFGAVSYDIQKRDTSETTWRKAEYGVTNTQYEVMNLDNNVRYQFRVKARDESGSASVWSTIDGPDLIPPQAALVAGDVNGDDLVTTADLVLLRAAIGQCQGQPQFEPLADLDHDDCVTFNDYRGWMTIYRALSN